MPLPQWIETLSVGVPLMDLQHRTIIDMLNRLAGSLEAGTSAMIEQGLDDLIEYTRFHFDAEERLMRSCNYPGLDEHQAEHQRLITEIQALRWRGGNAKMARTEIIEILSKWAIHHIVDKDLAYRPYIVAP
ncbi:bacteriohemerythrin [Magnetospirillum molischianum]|nr:bacteriohemerythrin [Magnetospirillum molischianum]